MLFRSVSARSGRRIYKAIRLVSLRNLFLPVISVVIAIGIYYFLPFRDVFSPTKVKSSTEAIMLYNQGHRYANINIDKLYYTGFNIMAEGEVTASYYYEISDNRCVFYILSGDIVKNTPNELEKVNVIVRLNEPDGLLENMITAFAATIGWTPEGVSAAAGAVVMDQTSYHLERYVISFILLVAFVIYSMTLVTINIIYIIAPAIHLSLLKYYATKPFGIKRALRELEQDFENRQQISVGNMYITRRYFYNLGKKEVHIVPIENIIMCYDHGRLISIFGIHIKMTHTLYFVGKHGEKIVSSEKKATDVAAVTDYLKEAYPDIIWGHTKENKAEAKARIREYKESEQHDRRHRHWDKLKGHGNNQKENRKNIVKKHSKKTQKKNSKKASQKNIE